MTVVWCNGSLRNPDEPMISVLDHGLTVGDGVFETCGVLDGQAFALTRHLDRLARSAHGLGIDLPLDMEVRRAVAEVLAELPAEEPGCATRLRITVTAGAGPLGSARAVGSVPTLVVAAASGPASVDARVVRVPWVRNERSAVAGLKTTSYAENVVALAYAKEWGADEALLANTIGELCEGTAANVFVEREGEVLTPPLSSGCLGGITRDLVLLWGQAAGLPVREAAPGELRYDDVLAEVTAGRASLAISGSVRGPVPVVELDGAPTVRGDQLAELCALYAARVSDDLDP
jgi:branched-chain amino acid aminotransferase